MVRRENYEWKRLADYVRTARDERSWSQAELAEQAGIGLSTVALLERGAYRTRIPNTVPAVERALGWAPGSARAVLAGGEPRPTRQQVGRPSLTGAGQKSPQVSFRVSAETRRRAEELAASEGKTVSELARDALEARVRAAQPNG